jgi:2-amino-4-hydroxy-6-hydroxymethyldihydropteridine diphosphokinase
MSNPHRAYLSLGSNIRPETHLLRAIEQLRNYGSIEKISNVWESQSVGAPGPNYLNVCVLLVTPLSQTDLKEQVLLSIETQLGRQRTTNKFASRTIDIDIVVFDEKSCGDKYWEQAFVVVPLAEIDPGYQNPLRDEPLGETAVRFRQRTWLKMRPNILDQITGNHSKTGGNAG